MNKNISLEDFLGFTTEEKLQAKKIVNSEKYSIGETFVFTRSVNHLTQKNMSIYLNVSQKKLSAIESGFDAIDISEFKKLYDQLIHLPLLIVNGDGDIISDRRMKLGEPVSGINFEHDVYKNKSSKKVSFNHRFHEERKITNLKAKPLVGWKLDIRFTGITNIENKNGEIAYASLSSVGK